LRATATKTLDGLLSVRADFYYKNLLKAIGGTWNPYAKEWLLPYRKDIWETLQSSIAGIAADECIKDELDEPYTDTDRPLLNAPPPPLKKEVTMYKHQYAAYAEACDIFKKGGDYNSVSKSKGYALLFEMG
jgi:hypothetical protein